MAKDRSFRNRPIERSVIALGSVLGASLYVLVIVLAIEVFLKPAGL